MQIAEAIARDAAPYVHEYLHKIRPKVADGEVANVLFLTMQGRPMSTGRLSSLVSYYLRLVGVRRKASRHAFRRTCATEMLRGGWPARRGAAERQRGRMMAPDR